MSIQFARAVRGALAAWFPSLAIVVMAKSRP